METVFQYEIPFLHPIAVHFPVALWPAAAVAAVVWMARGTRFWRRATLFLSGLGLAGVAFAYFTGEAAAEQAEGVPIVEELVGLHQLSAQLTFTGGAITVLALAAVAFWLERRTTIQRDPPDPLAARVALGLLVVAVTVLAAWTGHVGGTMTWGVAR